MVNAQSASAQIKPDLAVEQLSIAAKLLVSWLAPD
jgi:hypothetical protein